MCNQLDARASYVASLPELELELELPRQQVSPAFIEAEVPMIGGSALLVVTDQYRCPR